MINLFENVFCETSAKPIYVTFKDGRRAEYTEQMLGIFKQEKCVEMICDENGEVIFER